MNMSDTLISFETAKLAKEKQFQEYTSYFYTKENGLCSIDTDGEILNIYNDDLTFKDSIWDCNGDFWFRENTNNEEGIEFEPYEPIKYPAPTQSLVQKWLREKHKIILIIGYQYEYDSTPYSYWIYKEEQSLPINHWVDDLETYEEALEKGLQEALKLI